jgi:hypothetical protein
MPHEKSQQPKAKAALFHPLRHLARDFMEPTPLGADFESVL